jgi:hypothetical protein
LGSRTLKKRWGRQEGSDDDEETQMVARVYVCGGISVWMHGRGAPKLIYGCGRSLKGLKIKLEIKSEFPLKMKFRKI